MYSYNSQTSVYPLCSVLKLYHTTLLTNVLTKMTTLAPADAISHTGRGNATELHPKHESHCPSHERKARGVVPRTILSRSTRPCLSLQLHRQHDRFLVNYVAPIDVIEFREILGEVLVAIGVVHPRRVRTWKGNVRARARVVDMGCKKAGASNVKNRNPSIPSLSLVQQVPEGTGECVSLTCTFRRHVAVAGIYPVQDVQISDDDRERCFPTVRPEVIQLLLVRARHHDEYFGSPTVGAVAWMG